MSADNRRDPLAGSILMFLGLVFALVVIMIGASIGGYFG